MNVAESPEISVIIPCHNSTGTIGLQLEALAEQAEAPPFEVIVADNGSTDGLKGFLDPWRARLVLHYVDASHLRGPAYARNVGMSVAAAAKLVFCDSDDVVARDWVAQGSAALDQVEVFSGPGLKVADDVFNGGLDFAWRQLDGGLPAGQPVEPGRQVGWPILLGGNSGLRREVVMAVGGYDAGLTHGVEDNDLAVRLQQAGHVIAAAPGVRILYRERGGLKAAYRTFRTSGEWHMALCQRHDLWKQSPHLRGGEWRFDLLRCLGSGLRMMATPGTRDWIGLASRTGLAVGMWRGWWRFRALGQLPETAVGVGMGDHPAADRGRAVVFMPGVLSGGGAERYAVATAATLAELGYEAVLATTGTSSGELVGRYFGIDLSRVAVVNIASPPPWTARLPQAVFDFVEEAVWLKDLRALRPQLFVNCLYRSELVGVGDRNIYVCHFPHLLSEVYRGALRRRYMALLAALRIRLLHRGKDFRDTYDVVCANSGFTAGHIRDRWGVEPPILYPPCPTMPDAGERRRRIIAVGRIEPPVAGVPNKRLDVLVAAFSRLGDLHALGWELHVVGACPERSLPYLTDLQAQAAHAPVFFHPNATHEELCVLYATSTVYWHAQGFGEDASQRPETQEHFGITTVEAMSAGAIPVVIDTAGPREVTEAVVGIRRWNTIEELLAETRRLAALSDLELVEISRRCQKRAQEFDETHFRARLAEIIDDRGVAGDAMPAWLVEQPILVLSPHLDDAMFSASELIRRGDAEVWTVFAGDPEPAVTTAWDRSTGFADSHAQMVARRQEDKSAFAETGARVRHLPCLDAAYTTPERRVADLGFLRREVVGWVDSHAGRKPVVVLPACAGLPVPESPVDRVVQRLNVPASFPSFAVPLVQQLRELKHRAYLRRRRKASAQGLAVNGDHLAVRDAVLEALADDDRVTTVLAEDLPYLWWHPADREVETMATRWNRAAIPGVMSVDRQWKHDHIRHYRSQLDVMDAALKRLSSPHTLPTQERYWVLSPDTSNATRRQNSSVA